MSTLYTTAPADYDGFGTITDDIAGHDKHGKQVRRVTVDPAYLNWQVMRYTSGLYMAADETEWQKLVQYQLCKQETSNASA